MQNLRGRILLKVLLTAAIVAAPYFTLAQSKTDLQRQQQEAQQQQQQAQAAAENKAKEAQTLSKQITSLDSDIKSTESKISDTSGKIDAASAVITQLSGDIGKKTEELQVLKQKLNSSIVEVYRSASRSDWELLFSSNSLSDSVNQMKYTETIETQVKLVHSQVTEAKSGLEKQKSEQEAKKAELDQLQSQQIAYQKSAEYQKTQKDKLLGMTVEQQKEYEKQAEEKQQEVARLESQIRSILSSRKKNADGTFGSGPGVGERVKKGNYVGIQGHTGFATGDHVHLEVDFNGPANGHTNPRPYINDGTIVWPLDSFVVTQEYGCTDFARCGNSNGPYGGGPHMGIDIAGPRGSTVYAPADGKVVLNESFSGYGNAWAMKIDNGPYVLIGHLAD